MFFQWQERCWSLQRLIWGKTGRWRTAINKEALVNMQDRHGSKKIS
jgi:hypothetical protein